jgi:hypothetical protein
VFISCTSKSQTGERQDSNFIYLQNSLREYKIDTCLVDLLTKVVELDTNHLRFPPNKFYYDLTFENRKNYRNMTIIPSRWEKSMTLDHDGIIKVGQMSFLCRGDIKTDELFSQTKNKIEVQLKSPKLYQYDDIDTKIEAYTWKPTLAGKYTFCKGVPIDLYILVGNNLDGYGYGVKKNDR